MNSRQRAVTLTVLSLALIIFPFVPNTVADNEPNDDFSQAELIIPGTYEGSLLDIDERDSRARARATR